jgi:hypothetical protein
LIDACWDTKWFRVTIGESPLAFSPYIKAKGAIDTIHPFMIPTIPLPTDEGKQLAETIAGIPID